MLTQPRKRKYRNTSRHEGSRPSGSESVWSWSVVIITKTALTPLQKCVQCIETLEAPAQDFLVWQSFPCPTFQNTIDPDRFHPLKSGVVQIGVMNHLSYLDS